ncbi:MAG TPA: hypothetical protein VJ691_03730 [Vicinamibacterales bacterium]|nr:hypothetical protein [Vicinamibacterales bacterium]
MRLNFVQRNWHALCSLSRWSTVKSGILRTALPILTISGILLWSLGVSAGAGLPADQFQPVLDRFNSSAPPAYRAFRRLEAGKPDSGKHGWLEVWTEHRPGSPFKYTVISEGGYDYVRNKVLRGVLKGEAELLADGKPLRAPIVPRNYTIEDGGMTDSGLLRLLLHPARKSDGIVRGSALIAPDIGGIVRVEGRLTKSPSFWVRDVDVTWKFARIGNEIVPTELSSSARVVFYGRQPFKMTYEYVQVDGRSVGTALRAAMPDPQ